MRYFSKPVIPGVLLFMVGAVPIVFFGVLLCVLTFGCFRFLRMVEDWADFCHRYGD